MAGLQWGLQSHAIWHVCGPYSHAPYNLLIVMVWLLTSPIGDPDMAHLP